MTVDNLILLVSNNCFVISADVGKVDGLLSFFGGIITSSSGIAS